MTIEKVGSQFVLFSKKKGKDGKRKKLGTFKTRAMAVRRERQVNFFKHRK